MIENRLTCLNTNFQKREGKLWTYTYVNNNKAQIDYVFIISMLAARDDDDDDDFKQFSLAWVLSLSKTFLFQTIQVIQAAIYNNSV